MASVAALAPAAFKLLDYVLGLVLDPDPDGGQRLPRTPRAIRAGIIAGAIVGGWLALYHGARIGTRDGARETVRGEVQEALRKDVAPELVGIKVKLAQLDGAISALLGGNRWSPPPAASVSVAPVPAIYPAAIAEARQ